MDDPILENASLIHQHWQNVCDSVLLDDVDNWEPVYEIDFKTGNPIYSKYQSSTNKGIRIIHDYTGKGYGIYMRNSGTTDMVEDHIYELVFCLPYNNCAVEIFKSVLRVWIHPDTDFSYMNDLIARSKGSEI